MEFSELLKTRQSCRSYSDKDVSPEDVRACLEAARLAPSACNAQPFHMTVCTGELAKEVARSTQGMGMNAFATQAPCMIVFSEAAYTLKTRLGSWVKEQDYRSVDIGIAAAQLTLRATDLGLATCILGWFDDKKLRKRLELSGQVRLVIALGYAKEGDPLRVKSRKPLEELADFR